jgi:TusA-related sulfurtransferase
MTTPSFDPSANPPDRVFEGGDLDCGSGLVLLIRENMLAVPMGGVLEMRSREPSVRDDLPPWCRMVGHVLLAAVEAEDGMRYFIRRGGDVAAEARALDADKERAKEYEWRVRVRATGPQKCTAFFRNFSFSVGQPASFEEKDQQPSGVEYVLGVLAGDLISCFADECARSKVEIDDIEATARGKLHDVFAHLGLAEGDPSYKWIEVKCFASSLDKKEAVEDAWSRAVARSPLAATLRKAVDLELKIAIV